jgi:hypothetical protein
MPTQNPLQPFIYALGAIVTAAIAYKLFYIVLNRI